MKLSNPSKAERLSQFVLAHLHALQEDWGRDWIPSLPDLDVSPQDYLRFAEKELEKLGAATGRDATRLRVNCIGHLKRAIDGQIEILFHAFGLTRAWEKRGLKLERKLAFLEAAGILSARTLVRLNTLRNAVEHKFKSPDSIELDCLCDITTATVALLQLAIVQGATGDYEWSIGDWDSGGGSLRMNYEQEGPRISAVLNFGGDSEELVVGPDAHEEFAFFFRVMYLLSQLDAFYARDHLAELLRWPPNRSG